MPRILPIGIDLGTTFSVIAYVDDSGKSVVLRNAEGEILTPSVVLFSDSEVVVGRHARTALFINPDLVAEWVKRDMGAPYYSRPIHGQYLPPEVIQACILRKLKADIVQRLTADPHVVITVPAYFDEPRRKATADAGEMAGLKVLDIVNEPTAAALAFGEKLGYLTPVGTPREEMNVLVYDLGGGTFDVTLLHLAPGRVDTIATDGDVQLGGHDWDLRLVDYLCEQFRKAHRLDPRQDPIAANRVLAAAIDAKHALTARNRTTVQVEYGGLTAEIPVSRELFNELTADLLERTAYTTRQLIADAKMEWKDVSRVLLVGGSTRMPMVIDMLRKMTGIEPDRTVNPDEAVARGAALYAAYLLARRGEPGVTAHFEVTNVNSHSLGIEGIDPETMRKTNVILIPRNTRLPAKFTERFMTKTENQRSIVIQVLEGESSLPGECTAIGRTVIRDLPAGLPKGWPVDVTFEYGTNGRLSVRAVVPGTHHKATLEMERSAGLSSAGIAGWRQLVESGAGFEAFRAASQQLQPAASANWQPAASFPPISPSAPSAVATADQPATTVALPTPYGAATGAGTPAAQGLAGHVGIIAQPAGAAAAGYSGAAPGTGAAATGAAAAGRPAGAAVSAGPAAAAPGLGAIPLPLPPAMQGPLAAQPPGTAGSSAAAGGLPHGAGAAAIGPSGIPLPGAAGAQPAVAATALGAQAVATASGPGVGARMANAEAARKLTIRLQIPRWLFSAVGYVVSAVLGLALGAVVLWLVRPDALRHLLKLFGG